MYKIITILLLLPLYFSESHPVSDTDLLSSLPFIILSYHKSDAFGNQIEFDFRPFNDHALYRNIFSSALNFDYGLRFDTHKKPEHKFRFLLAEMQGINYKTILRYGGTTKDSNSGEYLFNHFGFKLLEWSNLKYFTEFNVLRLSNEFTLENRTHYSQHICPIGNFSQKPHNFYFIPRLSFEISNINLENNLFKLPSSLSDKSFWDIPISAYFEIGYDWFYEKESTYESKLGPQDYCYRLRNGINFFLDFKKYPLRNFEVFTYGAEIIIMPSVDIPGFTISFVKNEINIDNFKKQYYIFSLKYGFVLEFLDWLYY